jgi:hypothetical protein
MDRWVVMSNYQKNKFIIIYVNVKFNLNWYKYHGHENTLVNLPFHIHVGELKTKWGSYKYGDN